MCQPMPTGLYVRWDFHSESSRFIPRQNKTRSFEDMVMSCFQRTRPECDFESFFTTSRQKKIDCFGVDGFCFHCNTLFEAEGCFYHFWPCQELRPSLTEENIQRGSKKKEVSMNWDDITDKIKASRFLKCGSANGGDCNKTTNTVKQHIREHFPYKRSLAAEQLLEEIRKGEIFGYVQCDNEVPENLRPKFKNFPPIFKNTLVSRSDIGDFMTNYADEERFLSQPRKMLISSFTLQNGTLSTPLLLFYLQMGLVVTKIHRLVQYTQKKSFNSFVQSAVDARKQGDENPNSSVVAETMKLLANSFYDYQIIDRSRHTVTKYLTDEKMHATNNSKLFKKLDHVNNSLYEVELAKA